MSSTAAFSPGGYRFIPAVFQYSAGVAALPGHEIQRVTFKKPVPLKQGFERIEAFITEVGRPRTAFCACELRSPAPFTEQGFRAFNEHYVVTLGNWGLFDGKTNPVARSNVCPEIDPPSEPSFHAFSFATLAAGTPSSFVISGSGEAVAMRTAGGITLTAPDSQPSCQPCARHPRLETSNKTGTWMAGTNSLITREG